MSDKSTNFGFVSAHSSSKHVNLVAFDNDTPAQVVGRLVYFDLRIGNQVYRSIGTVTTMMTENGMFSSNFEMASSRGLGVDVKSKDVRKSDIDIQAVFCLDEQCVWQQYGSALPTSPATRADVKLLDEDTINEMLRGASYATIGYFRGLAGAPVPLNIPNFDTSRGASHVGILGRSGSGKTAMSALTLSTYMQHESHAILVIDPQGQWANENGMPWSPQNFAKGLGREVSVLRMSEDIQLPMDIDVLGKIIDIINLWSRFRRMGKENQESFSREVAERLAHLAYNGKFNQEPREILTKIFGDISLSSSTLSRIYTKGERQEGFRDELKRLAGIPVVDQDGVEEILTDEDIADLNNNWENILKAFTPLHSLFSSKNLEGGRRQPLAGDSGFLKDIFQVRGANPSKPAPYVILDMSPNIKLNAKAGMSKDSGFAMQKMLDDANVKALMLTMILEEMKRASEIAFAAAKGGNLNTQIVFDEAWRFAPEGKASPEIEKLADMLEGFALDTRKFGIGWTYILQSPADLKYGIWRQLTYVYAGYGLVGEDIKRLEGLTDDVSQINLYRQFISPAATGLYPFMIMGPISPLIFSTSPTFVNVFTKPEEFLEYNKSWINNIVKKRSLPSLTVDYMAQRVSNNNNVAVTEDAKSYKVGKKTDYSEPQGAPAEVKEVKSPAKDSGTLPGLPF